MTQEQFEEWLTDGLLRVTESYVLEGIGEKGLMPVGFAVVIRDCEYAHIVYPHVEWFPWATRRNKIEAAIAFINGMRREFLVVIRARENDVRFFEHLTTYGILQVLGRVKAFFAFDLAPENTCIIFRSRKPDNARIR